MKIKKQHEICFKVYLDSLQSREPQPVKKTAFKRTKTGLNTVLIFVLFFGFRAIFNIFLVTFSCVVNRDTIILRGKI